MSVKTKKELRKEYIELRKSFSKAYKAELDIKITERIKSLSEYKNAKTIFAFISKDIEVNTKEVLLDALSSGKKVAVPLCDTENTEMKFYYINSYDDLKKGYYGIMEPDKEKCKPAGYNDAELMIVPGLAFNRKGFRLGFGKGYYDRYIPDYKGITVGVCYDECIENEIMLSPFDKAVDMVVTDKNIIVTR